MAVEPYRTVGCPPITAVGVTTADRPEPLGRCLSSLMRQLRDRSADIRIIIVDGSKKPANESLNRSLARSLSASSGRKIVFIGSRERRTFTKDLHAICPSELVEFAVAPGASGNRNLAVLLTSGENVLLVDDDVVCDLWRMRSFRKTVDVCGHVERRDIAFFKTRAGTRDGMVRADTNLLDAHEALLGRSLQSLCTGTSMRVETSRACRFLKEGLAGVRNVVVRKTFSGLVGDVGTGNPERLLFGTGVWKHLLESSRQVYGTAFKYREVRMVADRYLVTHDPGCRGFSMGLANTAMVPPFLPTGRNEDGLFGLTLSAIDRTAVGGHIPYAVLHESTRPPSYGNYAFVSATQTRVADLMIHLVNSWPSNKATRPRQRLARLAAWLDELASFDEPEFARAIVGSIFNARERELRLIEKALQPGSGYPDYWQRDLRRYRQILLANLAKPEFFVPVEFSSARSVPHGYRRIREFVRMSSECLRVWPTLWKEARTRTKVG